MANRKRKEGKELRTIEKIKTIKSLGDKDFYIWNLLFGCKKCKYAAFCKKYGKYGFICDKFEPVVLKDILIEELNNYLHSHLKSNQNKYNPQKERRAKLTGTSSVTSSYLGINKKGGDSLHSYSVSYINDILRQIRTGHTDYVYDIDKLFIISAYEPNVVITNYYDGCYYISIKKNASGGE